MISFCILKLAGRYLFKWRVDIAEKETSRKPTPWVNKILQHLFLPGKSPEIPAGVCRKRAHTSVTVEKKHGFEEMSI